MVEITQGMRIRPTRLKTLTFCHPNCHFEISVGLFVITSVRNSGENDKITLYWERLRMSLITITIVFIQYDTMTRVSTAIWVFKTYVLVFYCFLSFLINTIPFLQVFINVLSLLKRTNLLWMLSLIMCIIVSSIR